MKPAILALLLSSVALLEGCATNPPLQHPTLEERGALISGRMKGEKEELESYGTSVDLPLIYGLMKKWDCGKDIPAWEGQ